MKFVAFQYNYSDECRAYGFALMTTEQWNEYTDKVRAGVGVSWAEIIYSEPPESFLELFEVTDIDKNEYDTLVRIFKIRQMPTLEWKYWGMFPLDHYIWADDDTVVDEW